MQWLKQSTAATVKIGPFLDSTDGDTEETGLTIAQADVRLSKNGGNIAQKAEATSCTHDELAIYGCPLGTTDTDTLGRLQLWVHEGGALLVWHEFMVVPANVWDSFFGADYLHINVAEISEDATAANNAEAFFDGTGYAGTNNVIPTVSALTGHTVQTGDSYARLGAPAGASIAADLVTIDNFVDDLESRLTAARAGYLDELAAANLPTDIAAIPTAAEVVNEWETQSQADPTGFHVNVRESLGQPVKFDDLYGGLAGPGVWIDAGANTNTVSGVDGIHSNPVSTLTAARTIADALGYKTYYLLGGISLTIAATHEDWHFIGLGEPTSNRINLGSQDVDRSGFVNLEVVGIQGGTERIIVRGGAINDPGAGATTLHVFACATMFTGDFELDTSNDNVFDQCFSGVAGAAAPVIIATGAAGTAVFRHYSGGIEFKALSASHNVSCETDGQVIFNADCNVNADVALRGNMTITDNTAGMNNLSRDAALSGAYVNTQADTALTDYDGPTNAEMEARTLVAASYFDPAADAVADVTLVATTTTNTDMVGTNSAALASVCTEARLAELAAANLPTDIDAILADTNELQTDDIPGAISGLNDPTAAAIRTEIDSNSTQLAAIVADTNELQTDDIPGAIAGLNDPTAASITDAVWDEALTGVTHNVSTSAGRRLREIGGLIITANTCQAGSTVSTVVLGATASATDGAYDPALIAIVDGTGAGQSRLILEYAGGTRTAAVDRDWKITPDDTSEYIVYAHPGREHVNEGIARGGTANTITLNTLGSAIDDAYNGQLVFIRAGVGEDQVRLISDYDGTTKAATVTHNWATNPTTASNYIIIPNHIHTQQENAVIIRTEIDSNSTQLAAIVADTNELQTDDVPGLIAALNDIAVTDITQRQIPDSIPADGTLPTIEQALYMITQFLYERAVSGTTVTVKKADGSTSLLTLTLDDGTDPTSITRAT
jgi:hypothetical protein